MEEKGRISRPFLVCECVNFSLCETLLCVDVPASLIPVNSGVNRTSFWSGICDLIAERALWMVATITVSGVDLSLRRRPTRWLQDPEIAGRSVRCPGLPPPEHEVGLDQLGIGPPGQCHPQGFADEIIRPRHATAHGVLADRPGRVFGCPGGEVARARGATSARSPCRAHHFPKMAREFCIEIRKFFSEILAVSLRVAG